jgi:uncharacterized repeat protein (TIGR02543 family)
VSLFPDSAFATSTGEDATTPTVSRIEWLKGLAETFDFSVEEDNYPDNYYADVSSDSEDYYTVMLATEFGVLDIEAGGNVYPEEPTTREFAVQTLNYCLGFQLDENYEYTFDDIDDVKYPDNAQIALNRGWLSLVEGCFKPELSITESEMELMLADAAEVVASAEVDDAHDNTYEFADYVKVFPESEYANVDEKDVVTISNPSVTIEKGDTFVVWVSELPSIYVAENVEKQDGTVTITTSEADTSTAVLSVDSSGTVKMDLSQFDGADGVEVEYVRTQSQARAAARAYSISASQNSVVATTDVKLPNGVKASITCNLSDLSVSHIIDTKNHKFYVSVKGNSTITSSVSLDVVSTALGTSSIELGYVSIAGVGKVTISAELALNGKITAIYTGDFEAGMQYSRQDGFRLIKNFVKKSFNTTAEANASIGVKVNFGVNFIVVSGNVYATTGISAKLLSTSYDDGSAPGNCTQISAWLYVSIGAEAKINLIVWKQSWSKNIDIYDSTNSPVRLSFHYEDGKQVYACARATSQSGSGTTDGTGNIYVTPVNSKYGTGSYGDTSSVGTSDAGKTVSLWTYTVTDNKATITGYNGNASIVSVPTKLDGYVVDAIGDKAFAENQKIKKIGVPEGVVRIGNQAFSGCESLDELNLPESLVQMGYLMIENTAIKSITIPKNVAECSKTYSLNAGVLCWAGPLANSKCLKKVIFEEDMETIPANILTCRGYDSYVTSVIIPTSVKNIGDFAFYGCNNYCISSLHEGVEKIGESAFEECDKIQTITIPKTIKTIGENAFAGCENLKSVIINTDKVGENNVTIGSLAFKQCEKLTTVELSENISSIGTSTFSGCTSLKNLTLPEYLTYIGDCFIENTAIESIVIPKNVAECRLSLMRNGSLANCKSLKIVIFEDGMKKIPAGILASPSYVSNVTTVQIPSSVKEIGDWAFYSSENLQLDNLPEAVQVIGQGAFKDCTKIKTIEIPQTIRNIAEQAFLGCTALESVVMQYNSVLDDTVQVGASAFADCVMLTTVELSENVSGIGNCAFSGCVKLKSLSLPENLKSLGYRFIENTSISSIVIPQQLQECGIEKGDEKYNGPLSGCETLKTVLFENGIAKIPSYVCANVSSLIEITLPVSVKKIKEDAFYQCPSLKTVYYSDGTQADWGNISIESGNDSLEEVLINYHEHVPEEKESREATCTKKGLTAEIYCIECGAVLKEAEAIPVIQHEYSIKEEKVAPTCINTGVDEWYCVNCGNSIEETVPTIEHKYRVQVVEPECNTVGYTEYVCMMCGDAYQTEFTAPVGHTWGQGVITVEATKTSNGIKDYTCEKCGESKSEIIPTQSDSSHEHDYVKIAVVEPTCTNDGYSQWVCSICNDTYQDDVVLATAHDYSIKIENQIPTCTGNGLTRWYCSNCDAYREEKVPRTNHNYFTIENEASCTAVGSTTYICANCGDTYTSMYTPPIGHTWDEGTIIQNATTKSSGIKRYKCIQCGEDKTEIIPIIAAQETNNEESQITVYKITYKTNGGTLSSKAVKSYDVTKAVTLVNPTRKEYTFAGWYSDSKFKNKVSSIKKGSTGNKTLYAKWTKVSVSKTTLTKVTNAKGKKLTATWKKVSGAKGYQLSYSIDKNFKKSISKLVTKTSYTATKLTKGKTYYVRVRAYKIDSAGNKVYAKWSNVKKIKITK